jgi:pimeloyl-ACP methyl ester carboxylesterase
MAETHGNWTEIEVARHTCHVFEPARSSVHGFTVLYLHCSHAAKLSAFPAFVREFERHGLRVIQPMSGLSWWTDRLWTPFDPSITAEAYVRGPVMEAIAGRWNARPPQVALLGVSMGGQATLRIAYKYPQQFPVVAAISPAIDFQKRIEEGIDPGLAKMYRDAEDARQDTATLHIHPLNWPRHQFFCCDPTDVRWHASADRLRMKLWSLGVPFECDLDTVAGGHSFAYAEHMAERTVGFIAESLERERLRIV